MADRQAVQERAEADGIGRAEPDLGETHAEILLPARRVGPRRPFDEGRQEPTLRQVSVPRDGQAPRPVSALKVDDLAQIDRALRDHAVQIVRVDDPAGARGRAPARLRGRMVAKTTRTPGSGRRDRAEPDRSGRGRRLSARRPDVALDRPAGRTLAGGWAPAGLHRMVAWAPPFERAARSRRASRRGPAQHARSRQPPRALGPLGDRPSRDDPGGQPKPRLRARQPGGARDPRLISAARPPSAPSDTRRIG
jgi:hypothetical protein